MTVEFASKSVRKNIVCIVRFAWRFILNDKCPNLLIVLMENRWPKVFGAVRKRSREQSSRPSRESTEDHFEPSQRLAIDIKNQSRVMPTRCTASESPASIGLLIINPGLIAFSV